MSTNKHRCKRLNLCLSVFICGFIFFLGSSIAQQVRSGEGLDSITDDALLNELAARGLNSLLERAFEVNKIPEPQRRGRRTLIALSRLDDPKAKLTSTERRQMVSEVVAGIDAALPAIEDPNTLFWQASVLIKHGAEPDVNTLEYWGENLRTQANLRPVAQAITRILDRCLNRAKAQADQLAAKITSPTSPNIPKFEQIEQLLVKAEYIKYTASYFLALSLDPADDERRRLATEAIDHLKHFDIPNDPYRGDVRNRMGKLAMLQSDFDAARKFFASVVNDAADPKPSVAQQYESRYFSAVAEIMARDPVAAQKGLEALLAWQQTSLPADKVAREGADAAAAMLQYRIRSLEAELAKTSGERSKANAAAVAVLMDLVTKRPNLREIIYDQLLPKLDDRADLSSLEPLALRALVAKGEQEVQKPAGRPLDTKTLERAVIAAAEIVRRRGEPGVDAQMIDASTLLSPFFMEKLGKKLDAANAFIDYAEQAKTSNQQRATLALDNAQSIIGELRAIPQNREDSAITQAYERFLPLAIGEPFNRRQFAFEYARRLQLNGNPAQSVRYYQLVPADDKRALQARFLELVALSGQLEDEAPNSPQRPRILSEIQKLADQVNAAVAGAVSQAKSDADRDSARAMLAQTSLLAADLARREQKNPQRALQLLASFDETVKGLPKSDELVARAMDIRVQSYMGAEKYTDATQELVRLLNKTGASQGTQVVRNLLQKLSSDFDRASAANDLPAMKALARNRAELSGFLVKWAAENSDPAIRKSTYRYQVFDADTQRRAAELEPEPTARKILMNQAMERYVALEAPPGLALYKASLDPAAAASPDLYDPAVAFGIALAHYDLGEYEPAATRLSKLLDQRKLGAAVSIVEENGVERSIDNDAYWEAALKLIRSNLKLNRSVEEARNFLRMQYITWGSRVGGKRWKSEFETLRTELIPDFKLQQ